MEIMGDEMHSLPSMQKCVNKTVGALKQRIKGKFK